MNNGLLFNAFFDPRFWLIVLITVFLGVFSFKFFSGPSTVCVCCNGYTGMTILNAYGLGAGTCLEQCTSEGYSYYGEVPYEELKSYISVNHGLVDNFMLCKFANNTDPLYKRNVLGLP